MTKGRSNYIYKEIDNYKIRQKRYKVELLSSLVWKFNCSQIDNSVLQWAIRNIK